MCYFISLVVKGGDPNEIDLMLRQHRRQAQPFNNASVQSTLLSDEALFLTTVEVCDCETALLPDEQAVDQRKKERSRQVSKLQKKGWSAAKIERWSLDRKKADERAEDERRATAPDSIELWERIIRELISHAEIQQAGLLLHFYSGDLESEVLETTRKVVPIHEFSTQLRCLQEDQILMAKSDDIRSTKHS